MTTSALRTAKRVDLPYYIITLLWYNNKVVRQVDDAKKIGSTNLDSCHVYVGTWYIAKFTARIDHFSAQNPLLVSVFLSKNQRPYCGLYGPTESGPPLLSDLVSFSLPLPSPYLRAFVLALSSILSELPQIDTWLKFFRKKAPTTVIPSLTILLKWHLLSSPFPLSLLYFSL